MQIVPRLPIFGLLRSGGGPFVQQTCLAAGIGIQPFELVPKIHVELGVRFCLIVAQCCTLDEFTRACAKCIIRIPYHFKH